MFKKIILFITFILISSLTLPLQGQQAILNSMTVDELYEKGLKDMEDKFYAGADACFTEITEREEASPEKKADAWYKKGVCYYYMNENILKEIEFYDNALKLNQEHHKAWYAKGWALYDTGKSEESEKCYNMAVSIAPGEGYKWYGEDNKSAVTLEALKNGTYNIQSRTFPDPVTLKDGKYEAVTNGLPVEVVIYGNDKFSLGDLNNDGKQDGAVVLVCSTGGSGAFRTLEAVIEKDGKPVHVASAFLGDRVVIEAMKIYKGQIIIHMLTQGPEGGATNPTVEQVLIYELEGGELIEVNPY